MTEDTPTGNQGQKPLHPIKIKCPICGHKPMQQLDTGVSMSTLRVKLPEESMERVVGTLVFCCERCWNFQSFIKTSAEA